MSILQRAGKLCRRGRRLPDRPATVGLHWLALAPAAAHECPVSVLLPLALLLACAPSEPGAAGDAGLVDLDEALMPSQDLAEHAPAAVVLQWDEGAAVDPLAVEVDDGSGAVESIPVDVASGRTVLAGFKPDSLLQVRMVGEVEGEPGATSWSEIRTADLPADLPELTVDVADPGALDGKLVLVTHVQSPPAVLAVDGDGDIVWWRIMDDDYWVSRPRLARDGQAVLVNHGLNDDDYTAGLRRFTLDGELEQRWEIEGANRDFVEQQDGTLAFIVNDERDVDGVLVRGDQIVEVAPDGTQTSLWTAWDWFPQDDIGVLGIPGEWTHGNALSIDEQDDAYLLTLAGLRAVVDIDRSSGQTNWVFGGQTSDFETRAGHDSPVQGLIHGVDRTDDSLLVFRNYEEGGDGQSSVVEYSLDPSNPVVTKLWEWYPDPAVYTPSLGNAIRMDSGTTLVNFATAGRLAEVNPDGSVRWQVSTELGGALGYSTVVDGLR